MRATLHRPPHSSALLPRLAWAASLLSPLVLGALLWHGQPEPPATPGADQRWTLRSVPPGAEVLDERGQRLGITPLTHQGPARPGRARLLLRKAGFIDQRLELAMTGEVSLYLDLVRSAP